MPPSVCHKRGAGLPGIGSRDSPLVTKPPSWFKSTSFASSIPYPKVPDAASTGLRSGMPQSVVASLSVIQTRLADKFPSLENIRLVGLKITDRETEDKFTVEHGMREKRFAARVDLCKQASIEVVARAMAEANQRKRHGRRELEVAVRFH